MASENFLYACLLYVCYSMHAILCVLFYVCYYERYHNIVTMIITARMRILITHNI